MSETYKYTFKRWSLRGKSDLMSITAMPAMTTLAYDRMAAAAWRALTGTESDLPRHDPEQVGAWADTYDAAKFCTDYAAGKQYAWACAACYSIKIPSDALEGTKAKVEKVLATVYGDRWLGEGAIVSAFLTSSATPPAWADILDGSTAISSSPDPAPDADEATVPMWGAPLRRITRSNTSADNSYQAELAVSPSTDATSYLHVVIRLSDYISVRQLAVTGGGTRDSAWIEGGAKIDGTTLAVRFDRAVTADGQATIELRNEYSLEDIYTNRHGFCSSIDNETAFALTYFQDTAIKPTSEPGDAVMMRRVLESREHQHIAQQRSFGGTYSAGHGIVVELATWGGYIGCRYQNLTDAPKWHRYELRGLFFVRSAFTSMETVAGLSFDSALAAIPAGETVRIAMYAHDGPLPPSSMLDGDRIGLNMISMHSASDYDVVSGVATTIKLAVGSHSSVNSDDSLISHPMYDAPVVPLGHYDIVGGTGLAANTMIPFAAPYTLPRYVAIFVAINVIKYDDNWVAAPDQHTSVRFNPSDFFLHIV